MAFGLLAQALTLAAWELVPVLAQAPALAAWELARALVLALTA